MFGEVVDGEMVMNDAGRLVEEEWLRTASVRPDVDLDAFVIMPNHFHGVIVIGEDQDLVRARRCLALGPFGPASFTHETFDAQAAASVPDARARHRLARTKDERSSLGLIIGQIKANSTRRINRLTGSSGKAIWHRNYYDHIIRDEHDLDRVRAYIAGNPGNWTFDRANRKESSTP